MLLSKEILKSKISIVLCTVFFCLIGFFGLTKNAQGACSINCPDVDLEVVMSDVYYLQDYNGIGDCYVQAIYEVGYNPCDGVIEFEVIDYIISGNCNCFQVVPFLDAIENKILEEEVIGNYSTNTVRTRRESSCVVYAEIFYPVEYLDCMGWLEEIQKNEPYPDTYEDEDGYWLQEVYPCGDEVCCLTEKEYYRDSDGNLQYDGSVIEDGECQEYEETMIPDYEEVECGDYTFEVPVKEHSNYDGDDDIECTNACGGFADLDNSSNKSIGTPGKSSQNFPELDEAKELKVYPNPFDDYLKLNIEGIPENGVEVTIVNLKGDVLTSENIDSNTYLMDLSDLPDGHYIINVSSEQHSISKSIVK